MREILQLKSILYRYEEIIRDWAIDKDEERHYIQKLHSKVIFEIQDGLSVARINQNIHNYLVEMRIIVED